MRQVDTFLSMVLLLPGEWNWIGEQFKSNTSIQAVKVRPYTDYVFFIAFSIFSIKVFTSDLFFALTQITHSKAEREKVM